MRHEILKRFKCHKSGHVIAGCRVKKGFPVQFVLKKDENLLSPYLYDTEVNRRKCKVQRETGATYDAAQSSLVNENDFTGGYVYLSQALGDTIKLPVAKVTVRK